MELKCIGHSLEYELMQLIHLFEPYMVEDYVLEAAYKENQVQIQLFAGEALLVTLRRSIKSIEDEKMNKKTVRESFKKMIYEILTELTGKEMPWGILTGIRPTKIVHEYLEKNMKDQEIEELLKKEYFISNHKIKLLIEVAKQELDILHKNKPDEISLYIGIPFCPTRCVYCSFTAYSIKEKAPLVEEYLRALYKEIDYIATVKKHLPIRSLYIGGGTPTSLGEEQFGELLGYIKKSFDVDQIEEYTVEAGRPDTITDEKLKLMKAFSVGRISINPQTMNQKTLDTIGRKHGVADIVRVFESARKIGHQNINMDIIVGLPGESIEDVACTLKHLGVLMPDSITVHTMAIKRASRLKEDKELYALTEGDSIEEMLKLCDTSIREMGLLPYYMYRQKNMLGNFENVGYAKPRKACTYNIEIMEEKQTILALGAGAITKIVYQNGERIDRVANVKNLEDYIARVDEMILRKKEGFIKYQ